MLEGGDTAQPKQHTLPYPKKTIEGSKLEYFQRVKFKWFSPLVCLSIYCKKPLYLNKQGYICIYTHCLLRGNPLNNTAQFSLSWIIWIKSTPTSYLNVWVFFSLTVIKYVSVADNGFSTHIFKYSFSSHYLTGLYHETHFCPLKESHRGNEHMRAGLWEAIFSLRVQDTLQVTISLLFTPFLSASPVYFKSQK